MLNTALFDATTIRLTALDAKEDSAALAKWTHDGRYIPVSNDAPARPMSAAQAKKMLEGLLKEADEKRNTFWFGIRKLGESELLGITGLSWVDWSNGAVTMALSMKDLAEYGRPATEETVALVQRYAFRELQMHCLNISVPAYNEGLIAVLERAGFAEEVRFREAVYRFGRRWDSLQFGILSTDWLKGNADA